MEADLVGVDRRGHTYCFIFHGKDPESVKKVLRELGNTVRDASNDFTWYDAAIVSREIRKVYEKEGD